MYTDGSWLLAKGRHTSSSTTDQTKQTLNPHEEVDKTRAANRNEDGRAWSGLLDGTLRTNQHRAKPGHSRSLIWTGKA